MTSPIHPNILVKIFIFGHPKFTNDLVIALINSSISKMIME